MPPFRPILVLAALCLALGSAGAAEEARGGNEPPTRRVQGRVLDATGWPLPGARIYALRRPESGSGPAETRPIFETSTDAEGRFTLDTLAPGGYQIDIEAPDHQAAHVGVHLPEKPAPVVPIEVQLWAVTTSAPSMPEAEPAGSEPPPPEAIVPGGLALEVTQALETGQLRRGRALLDRVDGERAADADLFYAVGEALLRAGETEDAVAALDGALARDPGHVEARYRRALGLLGLGRRDDAREEFGRVLELRSEGPLAEGARTALAELGRAGGLTR